MDHHLNFLGGAYGDIVGDIGEITLAQEPKWEWHTMKSVSFLMATSYSRKMSSTEVSEVKQLYKVRFYANEPRGPWKNFISSNEGVPETISTKSYTAAEINAMPTLLDMQFENEAKAIVASLPMVDIPKFSSSKEMIIYTHRMLRELSKEELHAYLLQTLTPNYFLENSKIVLSDRGDRKLSDVLGEAHGAKSSYKAQYCEHPMIKHEQDGMMELWNKAKDRKTRISVKKVGDTYKLSDISVYVFTQDADIARVEASQNCGEAIETKGSAPVTFGIGDACEVKVRGQWLKGTIKKKDNVLDNRYYVEVEQKKSGWYSSDQMKQSGEKQSDTKTNAGSKSDDNTTTQTFKVGDKVMGNWKNKGKWYKGTIKAVKGNKYDVLYDDGDKETCTEEQLKLNNDIKLPGKKKVEFPF